MTVSLPQPVRAVVDAAVRLGDTADGVVAVALVGSYARGTARPSSDVDLIVLSDSAQTLLEHDDWFRIFDPHARLIRAGDFGAVQERRLCLSNGLVVEVGVGSRSWASVEPVDPGTRRLVQDGLAALHDRLELLRHLCLACSTQ